jgi:hypothetical protein
MDSSTQRYNGLAQLLTQKLQHVRAGVFQVTLGAVERMNISRKESPNRRSLHYATAPVLMNNGLGPEQKTVEGFPRFPVETRGVD